MALENRYPNVFQPIAIGGVEIRNRIFLPAHTTNFAENFLPTDRHINYLRERAEGGVGLLFMDPLRVHPTALGRAAGLAGASQESLPKLRDITAIIRGLGARMFTQITHTGRHSDNFTDRLPAWGPSPTPWTTSGELPHQMTEREMAEVRDCYATTALFSIDAGFEGMEIHFGHGHLLHQFLSPACNSRNDGYGGSFENRCRYPFEVLDHVLKAVDGQVPVGVRVSVEDLMAGGCSNEEVTRIIERVARTPGVAFIHASVAAYHWPSIGHHVADMSYPPHPFLARTLEIAQFTGDVPLLAVNRYRTLSHADTALQTGAIHMVGMNRAHMADPYLISKTAAGDEASVRPCISSNHCIGQIALHRPISCMMNPRVGKEGQWHETIEPSRDPRRVLVIGGGPGGMEAARVAASRGHDTTLWEASDKLGGKLLLGAKGHRRGDLNEMRTYLLNQVEAAGVHIETGRTATAKDVAAFGPDHVVLASGAVPSTHPPGLDRSIEDAMEDEAGNWTGRKILIVDVSGSWASLSAAETLAARGAEVMVSCSPDSPFWDVNIYSRMIAMERLSELGVRLRPGLSLKGHDNQSLVFTNKFTGETETYPYDEALFASRGKSAFTLQSNIEALELPLSVVGDALAPHSLFEAMHDAQAAARMI